MNDRVASELRVAEKEIDSWFEQNQLFNRSFAECAWYLLALYEDFIFLQLYKHQDQTVHTAFALADYVMVNIQYPLRWAWQVCPKGGTPPVHHDESAYVLAHEISKLAENYSSIEAAYTYASQGYIKLQLNNHVISPAQSYYSNSRYEAYDRLLKPQVTRPNLSLGDFPSQVSKTVHLTKDSFHYKFSNRIVGKALKFLSPLITIRYDLPNDWHFGDFSLDDFRRVASVLIAMAHIHFYARQYAASQGCYALGINNSVLLIEREQLEWNLVRFAGVSFDITKKVVEILVYGAANISRPDPALQPLIPLNDNLLAIAPCLFMFNAIERNFSVLLNKIPSLKRLYLNLVGEKESIMVETIRKSIRIPQIRFFHGYITNSKDNPDIDLALISDEEKVVLVLEIKWFIEPSDAREVLEKSEEIAKGVKQSLKLKELRLRQPDVFNSHLDIDNDYSVDFAVASENFIGHEYVQHKDIPIVNITHINNTLNKFGKLGELIRWLNNREYLPVEGREYCMVEERFSVGPWSLIWPGIEVILKSEYQ